MVGCLEWHDHRRSSGHGAAAENIAESLLPAPK
jgi:hypothetical protein